MLRVRAAESWLRWLFGRWSRGEVALRILLRGHVRCAVRLVGHRRLALGRSLRWTLGWVASWWHLAAIRRLLLLLMLLR